MSELRLSKCTARDLLELIQQGEHFVADFAADVQEARSRGEGFQAATRFASLSDPDAFRTWFRRLRTLHSDIGLGPDPKAALEPHLAFLTDFVEKDAYPETEKLREAVGQIIATLNAISKSHKGRDDAPNDELAPWQREFFEKAIEVLFRTGEAPETQHALILLPDPEVDILKVRWPERMVKFDYGRFWPLLPGVLKSNHQREARALLDRAYPFLRDRMIGDPTDRSFSTSEIAHATGATEREAKIILHLLWGLAGFRGGIYPTAIAVSRDLRDYVDWNHLLTASFPKLDAPRQSPPSRVPGTTEVSDPLQALDRPNAKIEAPQTIAHENSEPVPVKPGRWTIEGLSQTWGIRWDVQSEYALTAELIISIIVPGERFASVGAAVGHARAQLEAAGVDWINVLGNNKCALDVEKMRKTVPSGARLPAWIRGSPKPYCGISPATEFDARNTSIAWTPRTPGLSLTVMLRPNDIEASFEERLESIRKGIAEGLGPRVKGGINRYAAPDSNDPPDLHESLKRFREDHPVGTKTAFIMMRFGETKAHKEITAAIREGLKPFGVAGLRADDRQYHDDVLGNVRTYMHGCTFGVAVFERLESDEFNPNVSLEVGYMLGQEKLVCLLKDKTLPKLPADLVGRLYRPFDPQDPRKSIPDRLANWLRDWGRELGLNT